MSACQPSLFATSWLVRGFVAVWFLLDASDGWAQRGAQRSNMQQYGSQYGQLYGGVGWSRNWFPNQGRSQIVIPFSPDNKKVSRHTGLQLLVVPFQASNFGYQRISVTVADGAPSTSARQITLRFHAGNQRGSGRNITVEQDGELPLGAVQTTIELTVPYYLDWQQCALETWIDGRKDSDLSVDVLPGPGQPPGEGTAMLVAAKNEAPPHQFLRTISQSLGGIQPSGSDLKDLPTRWIHYTPYDVVFLSTEDFLSLNRQFPERTDALLQWVRAGGNLWLFDADRAPGIEEWNAVDAYLRADAPWFQLQAIDAVLHRTTNLSEMERDASTERWQYLPLGDRSKDPVESVLTLDRRDQLLASAEPPTETPDATRSNQAGSRRSDPWFQAQGYGMGVVLAFSHRCRRDDGVATALDDSLAKRRIAWEERHGFKPSSGSVEFNNWLLPGVGLAPVGMFQFLVTLFVLAIGPLNYVLLKRSGRLPMLLATAPLGAAGATVLLFGYGFFADGFGIQVRARSLTVLDQQSGEAVWWSRLSYYASTAPDHGLSLPNDVVLYPLRLHEGPNRRGRGGRADGLQRALSWDDRQHLTRGWLAPRTPTQYVQVGARRSSRRLTITTSNDALRVKNGLGVDVLHLAVEDGDGMTYWIENLASEAEQTASPVDPTIAFGALRKIFSDKETAFPPGASSLGMGGTFYDGPLLSKSLLETNLAALNSPLARRLGPRRYLAITQSGIELDLGSDDAREDASFHVIKGNW